MIEYLHFPDSARKVEDTFCYVNIDFDLFQPTKAALDFFWPMMSQGGVITVHDYFADAYRGIRTWMDEFAQKLNITPVPIGDGMSVALQK